MGEQTSPTSKQEVVDLGLEDVSPLDIVIKPDCVEIYFDADDGLRTRPSSVFVEIDDELVSIDKLIETFRKEGESK